MIAQRSLLGTGADRFWYRSVEAYTYKHTPQGELRLWVYRPYDLRSGDRRPGIVFFFGGAWRGGTVRQFARQATYLASRGMIAACADYRVRERHGVTPDKCVEDAKSAVRWLREHAGELGLDPGRLVASGGSAGGHIAACTATVRGLEAEGEDLSVSSRPDALLLFNPVLQVMPRHVPDMVPTAEMAERLSPVSHIDSALPPTLILFGTDDRLFAPAPTFVERATAIGCRAELYTAEGAQHGFFNDSPWFERTLRRADEFLASLGYLEGAPLVEAP